MDLANGSSDRSEMNHLSAAPAVGVCVKSSRLGAPHGPHERETVVDLEEAHEGRVGPKRHPASWGVLPGRLHPGQQLI